MTEEMTTGRILREDQQKIEIQFGKPLYRGIHKLLLLIEGYCIHPEADRIYSTAMINAVHPGEALNANDKVRIINGFLCQSCNRYIFPNLKAES